MNVEVGRVRADSLRIEGENIHIVRQGTLKEEQYN